LTDGYRRNALLDIHLMQDGSVKNIIQKL